MLSLEFAGWFCCRLSTDPDPSDEPRGVSGWSYALAGEPDLDRLIRFQDAPVVRRPGPDVGVNVRRVVLDGQPLGAHPLLGARVELLDEAKFEGRNGLVSEDGWEPMLPFHLAISGDDLRVSRRDPLGAQERPIWEIEPQLLLRQFLERETRPTPEQVLGAAGIPSANQHFRARRTALRSALTAAQLAGDEVAQVALDKRLRSLRPIEPRMLISYGFKVGELGGEGIIDGGADPGAPLDSTQPWPFRAWLGAWDVDALCGFARGRLEIPTL